MFLTEMPEDDAQGFVDYIADCSGPYHCLTVQPILNFTRDWVEVNPSDCLSLY